MSVLGTKRLWVTLSKFDLTLLLLRLALAKPWLMRSLVSSLTSESLVYSMAVN